MMIEKINKVKKSIKNLQYVLIFYGAVFIISISAIINNNVINNEYKLENKILKDSIDRMHLSDSIYQYLLSFNKISLVFIWALLLPKRTPSGIITPALPFSFNILEILIKKSKQVKYYFELYIYYRFIWIWFLLHD